MWLLFACGSALFAGITSILAKCGIRKTDSTVATAIPHHCGTSLFLAHGSDHRITESDFQYRWQDHDLPDSVRPVHRRFMAVLFQGSADR